MAFDEFDFVDILSRIASYKQLKVARLAELELVSIFVQQSGPQQHRAITLGLLTDLSKMIKGKNYKVSSVDHTAISAGLAAADVMSWLFVNFHKCFPASKMGEEVNAEPQTGASILSLSSCSSEPATCPTSPLLLSPLLDPTFPQPLRPLLPFYPSVMPFIRLVHPCIPPADIQPKSIAHIDKQMYTCCADSLVPSHQPASLQCKQPSVFPSGWSSKFKIGAYFGLTNLSAIISQPVLLFKHHEIPRPVNSSCPPNQPLRPIAFLNCFQLCYGGQREEDFHFKSKQWKDTNVAETKHPGNYPHFPLHPAYELHKYIRDTYFESRNMHNSWMPERNWLSTFDDFETFHPDLARALE